MTVSPLSDGLHDSLLSDKEIGEIFGGRAQVDAMLRVEAALARAQGRLGVIPGEAAERIAQVAATAQIDPASLAKGTANAGVPIPALVAALRQAVGGTAARYVHWGATSQDIIDTGLILRLSSAIGLFEGRLDELLRRLVGLAQEHRGTIMAARTRSQQALPTTFGLKVTSWIAPLLRHRERLAELKPRLLVVQFGGAAGTLAALGDRGLEVAEALAAELGLSPSLRPWHSERDTLVEFAGWLSLVTGSLGKLGQDLILLVQSEVGEVGEGSGAGHGGSSTLPQKSNPVSSEVLVTAARMNAALLGAMHQALVHEHERGGAGWQLEWLTLPQMSVLAGAALRHGLTVAAHLDVRAEAMQANLDASNGLVLAEAATFALAEHMALPDAQALVKSACETVRAEVRHLMDVLPEQSDAAVDWDALRDPANYLGATDELIERTIAKALSTVDGKD